MNAKKATTAVRATIPAEIDNVPVKGVETGKITAFGGSCNQAP